MGMLIHGLSRSYITRSSPCVSELSSHHVTKSGHPGYRLNTSRWDGFLRDLQETVLNQPYTVALFLT